MGKKRSEYVSQKLLDSFYEKVANDIENNIQDKGVWAKAFAKADGDENKAKAIYIEFMVEEMILKQEMHQEEEKRRIREQQRSSNEDYSFIDNAKALIIIWLMISVVIVFAHFAYGFISYFF